MSPASHLEEIESIYRHAPVGLCVIDTELRYLRINNRLAEMNGFPVRDHIGRSVREMVPHLADQAERQIRQVLETGEPLLDAEISGITEDRPGVTRTWTVNWLPLREDGGAITGISFVVQEITARKQVEEALRRSQQELAEELEAARLIQRISTQMIQADDLQALYGQILDTAKALMCADYASLQMFYADRGPEGELRLIGHRGFGQHVAEFRDGVGPDFLCACGAALRTRKRVVVADIRKSPMMAESRHRDAYLRMGVMAMQTTPLLSRSGNTIGLLSTHWRRKVEPTARQLRSLDVLARQAADLIDRRNAEEALRSERLQLRDSEERFRLFMDNSPAIAWIKNEQGRYTYISNTALARYNMCADDVIGKTDADLFDPGTAEKLIQNDREATSTGHAVYYNEEVTDLSGRFLCWRNSKFPFQDSAGNRLLGGIGIEITELKEMEKALQESEEKFRSLFEHGHAAVFITVPDGTIESANPAACAMFGYSEQDLRDKGRSGILDGNDPRLRPALEERRRQGYAKAVELTAVRKGGEKFPVEVDSVILPVSPARSFVIVRDITERKQAQEALQESEERFRTLANHMSQFAWIADADGWINWYNRRWYAFTGTDPEQMQGWGWTKVHHPDHVDRVVEKISRCFRTGEVWEDTFPLRGRDGRYRWFLARAVPIRDASGSILHWFGTNTDITEQREAEEALRESEARLSAILNQLPIGVGVYGKDGRAVLRNDLMRIYMPGMMPSHDPDCRQRWHAVDSAGRPIPPEAWPGAQILNGASALPGMELNCTDEQGRDLWLMVSAVPFANLKNGEKGAIMVAQDITALKKAENALRESNQELNEYNYAVIHNVKAPFRAVQNYANFLIEDLGDSLNGEPRQFLDGINTALVQARHQFDDLDALYHIRKYAPEFEPVNLVVLLNDIGKFHQTAGDRRLIVPEHWPVVWAEIFLLRQILTELIANGFKYNRSEIKEVEVGWQLKDHRLVIFVRDNGIGIDPQYHEHIFHIFKRLHTENEYEGTGIGLAIVRRAVKKIGGEVSIRSAAGEGSTFFISLPAGKAATST